jgi:hypothetical protein
MIPLVQHWISPDRVRPSPVQSSPSNLWTGIGPIPTISGPGLNWPGLIWTSLAQCLGLGYFFTVSVPQWGKYISIAPNIQTELS